jgi:hypothetical protein
VIDVTFQARERLAAQALSTLKQVGTLADMEAMKTLPRSQTMAYVAPLREFAEPGEVKQASVQVHVMTFVVAIVTNHAGDSTGARGADALTPLRSAVQACLVGWVPQGCHTPVQFLEGSLMASEAGTTVWQDVFAVRRRVQRPQV